MAIVDVPVQFTGTVPVEVPDEVRGLELDDELKAKVAKKIAVAVVTAQTDAVPPERSIDEISELIGGNIENEGIDELLEGVVGASGKWEDVGFVRLRED